MTSIADLRESDIGFGPIGGFVPGAVPVGAGQLALASRDRNVLKHWREWWTVRHVFVVTHVDPVYIAQAMPSGYEEVALEPARHWTRRHVYIRPPYRLNQAERVAYHARRMADLEVPYAFEDYAAIAAKRFGIETPALDGFIARTDPAGYPRRAICSQGADACMTLAGYHPFQDGRLSQNVTPYELFLKLIQTQGSVALWPDGSELGKRRWWIGR